jgi:hypothetical protein
METKEELHSFPFEETIGGTAHHYRITEPGQRYAIEKDGITVGEVERGKQWMQVSGDPLDNALLSRIYNCI